MCAWVGWGGAQPFRNENPLAHEIDPLGETEISEPWVDKVDTPDQQEVDTEDAASFLSSPKESVRVG